MWVAHIRARPLVLFHHSAEAENRSQREAKADQLLVCREGHQLFIHHRVTRLAQQLFDTCSPEELLQAITLCCCLALSLAA